MRIYLILVGLNGSGACATALTGSDWFLVNVVLDVLFCRGTNDF